MALEESFADNYLGTVYRLTQVVGRNKEEVRYGFKTACEEAKSFNAPDLQTLAQGMKFAKPGIAPLYRNLRQTELVVEQPADETVKRDIAHVRWPLNERELEELAQELASRVRDPK
ncbi:hypothetical protein HY489_01555 [Candidatus Woesearchaeota archaeon]|nr:hypothetical protein [Candidatus Woesearchaeota archaeon]